ncbi:MAG TPA: DUF1572 domain-containing protein [Candidatus Acidoferrum sp.]|nr:DUF1572 domain-containing protein [Candidatus Acidoferrum sp.]
MGVELSLFGDLLLVGLGEHNTSMALEFTASYIKDSVDILRYYKKLGERAIAQAPDDSLTATLDPESNSIAIIVKHLAGNMRSRWTDFLTSDGEKPDRNRDVEFELPPQTRAEILALWESAWKIVFDSLAPLTDADLGRTVRIRGERHSVMQAINRQIAHYAYHIGQIVYIAKHFTSDRWKSLSVPRGKSSEFNARVQAGQASQR